MTTVTVVHTGAALETHAVVAGAVQVCGRIEIGYLFFLDTIHGIIVHHRQHVGIMHTSTDAGRGDEVCVVGQSLREEHLIASPHHATVVQVYIVDKQPSTQTVGLQRTSLLCQLHHILIKEQSHLIFRVGCHVVCAGIPQVAICSVACLEEFALQRTRLYVCQQIHP